MSNVRLAALVKKSPSSRRAWIEISGRGRQIPRRKQSPSSRRAWIEILTAGLILTRKRQVALLAEGVDRNMRVSRVR